MAKAPRRSKKKPPEDKKGRGRPSSFREEYCDQVVKLCRLGATDQDLCDFFGVTHPTLNSWKQKHPEFLSSLRAGKIEADMQVANSLFKRATGYVVEVEKIMGRGEDRKVVKLNVAVEPDTDACKFWLQNRRKDYWRNRVTSEVVGKDDGPIETRTQPPIDPSKLSTEELEAFDALLSKAKPDARGSQGGASAAV